ncbi:hypothetical protein BKA62DRAFT_620530 [Auriculariales sp. MPI-PUGE-AT-0066]|nr:hypothetical protein BKA62DRAFT_620530 [Auriculariales sp. MPI-PUGE-AT-0066]
MQSLPSFTFHRPPDQGERTTIRTRLVEKLNKNGNRCCAWHETRQEVHAYGPREAPEGIMTCGCTVEQALFEEALAKNSVGALETGRKRLDPALRNALLELLKRSYDYRDGDLAFDRRTLSWRSGETPAEWSQKVKFYQ